MVLFMPLKIKLFILNKRYSKVHVEKHLSDTFFIQNDLKQGDALSLWIFYCTLEFAIGKV